MAMLFGVKQEAVAYCNSAPHFLGRRHGARSIRSAPTLVRHFDCSFWLRYSNGLGGLWCVASRRTKQDGQ